MTLVRPFIDLTADAHPERLVRIVPLKDRLKLEAQRRISDLFFSQYFEPALDVFARHRGLELLDPHEILVVQRAQSVDAQLQLVHQAFDLYELQTLLRVRLKPSKRRYLDVVEADLRFPIIESKVIVPEPTQRL